MLAGCGNIKLSPEQLLEKKQECIGLQSWWGQQFFYSQKFDSCLYVETNNDEADIHLRLYDYFSKKKLYSLDYYSWGRDIFCDFTCQLCMNWKRCTQDTWMWYWYDSFYNKVKELKWE